MSLFTKVKTVATAEGETPGEDVPVPARLISRGSVFVPQKIMH